MGTKIQSESHTKPLAALFALFLLFSFPLLKLQVFSQSFALTGEDQPESSLLATMWDWRGEVAAGSAAAELFYTYAITHPTGAEFTTCLYPLPTNTLEHYFRFNSKVINRRTTTYSLAVWIRLLRQQEMMNVSYIH